jgi:hypothetical protein
MRHTVIASNDKRIVYQDKDFSRKITGSTAYDETFTEFRLELLDKFNKDEGSVEEFFILPFEIVTMIETNGPQNRKAKVKGNTLANFEEQNALINRFKVE